MTLPTIGFIGGGRVTRILMGGWRHAGMALGDVVVSEPAQATRDELLRAHPAMQATDAPGAAAQDIVFLAIHPPVVADTLGQIAGAIKPGTIVVYLGSKVTLATLARGLGGHGAIARVIPNAPSIIAEGYNPIAMDPRMTSQERARVAALFRPLGALVEVAEAKLEGYVLLTGMGPTYLWFQWQELREIATSFGLTPEEIAPALEQMSAGALRTLLTSGLPPEQTMDLVPVKPLAEEAPAIKAAYRERLPALYAKIRPQ